MKRRNYVVMMSTVCLLIGATQFAAAQEKMMMHEPQAAPTNAIAVLSPVGNSGVHGTMTFTKVEGGIKLVADVEGLTPGKHGFHIHEYGDCSAPDGTSAGGHFNPTGMMHGAPMAPEHHEGDMGNLTADKDGKAHLELTDPSMTLSGPNSIIGRGIIVHAGEDDLKTQPTGSSGARVACGVIGIAK